MVGEANFSFPFFYASSFQQLLTVGSLSPWVPPLAQGVLPQTAHWPQTVQAHFNHSKQ
jgi:hypothetical protein